MHGWVSDMLVHKKAGMQYESHCCQTYRFEVRSGDRPTGSTRLALTIDNAYATLYSAL